MLADANGWGYIERKVGKEEGKERGGGDGCLFWETALIVGPVVFQFHTGSGHGKGWLVFWTNIPEKKCGDALCGYLLVDQS